MRLQRNVFTLISRIFGHNPMFQLSAAERNKEPILSVLKQVLPLDRPLRGLEIASGAGQHVSYFAQHLPNITWQPTEYDKRSVESIKAYRENLDGKVKIRVKPPALVDASKPLESWPSKVVKESFYDFILCINMTQVSPYECTIGLFRSGSRLIKMDGFMIIYGAFAVDGVLTPESNVAFDRSLREKDATWGVRDTRNIDQTAQQFDFKFIQLFNLPANNKILIYQKN